METELSKALAEAAQTYEMRDLQCGNCGWVTGPKGTYRIPRGQPVARTECPRCGCRTLGGGRL